MLPSIKEYFISVQNFWLRKDSAEKAKKQYELKKLQQTHSEVPLEQSPNQDKFFKGYKTCFPKAWVILYYKNSGSYNKET